MTATAATVWSLPVIPPQGTLTVTLTAQVANGLTGTQSLPVTAVTQPGQLDLQPANNQDAATIVVGDLPFGTVRIKKGGGTGGHKGLVSIKQHLGNADFIRVRMGIGRPQRGDVTSYVLNIFSIEEIASLPGNGR